MSFIENIKTKLYDKKTITIISNENEYSNEKIYDPRILKDLSSDCYINNIFNTTEKNLYFLDYIHNFLSCSLEIFLPYKILTMHDYLIDDNSVFLLFKGGNMMNYYYNEIKKKISNKKILSNIDPFFKNSDYDFTLFFSNKYKNDMNVERESIMILVEVCNKICINFDNIYNDKYIPIKINDDNENSINYDILTKYEKEFDAAYNLYKINKFNIGNNYSIINTFFEYTNSFINISNGHINFPFKIFIYCHSYDII